MNPHEKQQHHQKHEIISTSGCNHAQQPGACSLIVSLAGCLLTAGCWGMVFEARGPSKNKVKPAHNLRKQMPTIKILTFTGGTVICVFPRILRALCFCLHRVTFIPLSLKLLLYIINRVGVRVTPDADAVLRTRVVAVRAIGCPVPCRRSPQDRHTRWGIRIAPSTLPPRPDQTAIFLACHRLYTGSDVSTGRVACSRCNA